MSNQEMASTPESDPPYNSNFIVKSTYFSSKSNYFYRDGDEKLKTMFQKKFDQVYNDNDNNTPARIENTIQVPVLDEKTAKLMKQDVIASYSGDFYKGIINYQNSKFNQPPSKSGFLLIFGDTKKSMANHIDYLVDCKKETNWYSTKKQNPSITIYFPHHIISLEKIGFRSHSNQNFGKNFLNDFTIFEIRMDKKICCIGRFQTNQLNDYEAKATFEIGYSTYSRVLHIVSNSGKFGLSMIEIYGKAINHDDPHEGFSEDFITNPSTYEDIYIPSIISDSKKPRKSLAKKLFGKKKKRQDDDDDDFNESSDEEIVEPKKVEKKKEKLKIFEAYDASGPGLIQKYFNEYDKYPELRNSTYYEVIMDKYSRLSPKIYFALLFKNLIFTLTGVKITTRKSENDLPNGLVLFGHLHKDESKHEEWRHVFSSYTSELAYDRHFYYKVETQEEFTDFVLYSYNKKFNIERIEFYGKAREIAEPVEYTSKQDYEFEKLGKVLFEEPPVGSFLKLKKPGIFQTMEIYYSSMLCGFVEISVTTKDEIEKCYTRRICCSNNNNPLIRFVFLQHRVKIKRISISSNSSDLKLGHFYIIANDKILAERDYKYEEGYLYFVNISDCDYIKSFFIYNPDGPFSIENIEIHGILIKDDKYCSGDPVGVQNATNKIKEIRDQPKIDKVSESFTKELMVGVESDPKIVVSANDSSSYRDLIVAGNEVDDEFVSFYTFGKNGHSILCGNSNNIWMTTTNNKENSFKVVFNHHSVRLKKFGIQTVCDPKYSQYSPSTFYLFGYNSHAKHWDVILDHISEKTMDIRSHYTFDINENNQNIFYRIIKFITLSGQVAISYIKLYGDAIEETDEMPEDEATSGHAIIEYKSNPKITALRNQGFSEGIFRKAMKIYGPELDGFVQVVESSPSHVWFYDIWGARNEYYESIEKKDKIIISIYFLHHAVSITGYQIRPFFNGSIDNWCIIGCTFPSSDGEVIAHQKNCEMEDDNLYYSFKTNDTANNRQYRAIRFVGLSGKFLFHSLDLYGVAYPVNNVLTKSDINKKFDLPFETYSWYVGD